MHRRGRERRLSDSSILTERRRSCPPDSASIISFGSEHATALDSATTPTKGSDLTDFQQRRRRAAKLTQFFGVQYRELINDVLDSLENGLEHEQKRGTLQADEIAVSFFGWDLRCHACSYHASRTCWTDFENSKSSARASKLELYIYLTHRCTNCWIFCT